MLYFYDYQIVLQEVPHQISLCYNITGCKLACKGCHSPFLWKEKSGTPLTNALFLEHLNIYKSMISCVLFMGGEWEEEALIEKLEIAEEQGLFTCLYTGENEVSPQIKTHLTWLKTGAWVASLGGLDQPSTNQKFIEVATNTVLNHLFVKQ